MDCLDEDTVIAFCQGHLPAATRADAERHLSDCDECRALVSALARSSDPLPSEGPLAMAPTRPASGVPDDARAPSSSPSAPVKAGDVLDGKYEVERVLGVGGMGVVVAARHLQLEQRVALKFLRPNACETPGAVERFLREGRAAARLQSEHVARVLDTGTLEGGAPYLVLEYLEGRDLGAVVGTSTKLPWDVAVDHVLQACEGIALAHAHGIIHRDLKPANLFLTKRADGSPRVVVLDFGISKVEGAAQGPLTSVATLMGSPRYMSPEQMRSSRDVDARTDIWALGVVLFELVTGQPVWTAENVQGLCALIATAPAPSLRSAAPEAPNVLESVIARCLAKAKEERFESIADLAIALKPIAPASARTSLERILGMAGRPLPMPPPTAVASKRTRKVGLAAASVLVMLLGAVALRAPTSSEGEALRTPTGSTSSEGPGESASTPPETKAAADAPTTAAPAAPERAPPPQRVVKKSAPTRSDASTSRTTSAQKGDTPAVTERR